ncbi:peptidoglycan-binding protein [Bacillus sp. FJAT-42376]|uniref:peptidoglycan-binding protein n=1 Tax=Bacillus sp. FJAT-42376 TaxID=2014076 RepID=UPI0013DDFE93|nr:peptidoglycan-binding protein [Bacillus sp. FJAT-42376]
MFKKTGTLLGVCMLGAVLFTPAKGEAALGDQLLHKGMSNGDVKELQTYLLTKQVYPYYDSTGNYGSITEEAVRDFQKKAGIKSDGIAGPQTIAKIKVLKPGNIGKPVADLQNKLKAWNVYSGAADGMYGSGTKNAVARFQSQKGLSADGIAGPRTFNELNKRVNTASGTVKEVTVHSTAYTASCKGCSGVTKMGIDLNRFDDSKVIAVDPNVIPLGSAVEVEGYGRAVAGDVGGAINGNEIDVFFDDLNEAMNWGSRQVKVKVYR